jgi:hypothetical protein
MILGAALRAEEEAPEVVILKGNPMGGVKFDRAAHAEQVGDNGQTCPHRSRLGKALESEHRKCADCHKKENAWTGETNRGAAARFAQTRHSQDLIES